jgi:hypothetical protein
MARHSESPKRARIAGHPRQRRLAALARPMDQHHGRIGQRLGEARLGEAGMERGRGHAGQS